MENEDLSVGGEEGVDVEEPVKETGSEDVQN